MHDDPDGYVGVIATRSNNLTQQVTLEIEEARQREGKYLTFVLAEERTVGWGCSVFGKGSAIPAAGLKSSRGRGVAAAFQCLCPPFVEANSRLARHDYPSTPC